MSFSISALRNQYMVIPGNGRRQHAVIKESNVGTARFQADAPSHSLRTNTPSPSKSLTLDLESVARTYFLSRHAVVGSEVRGQYEFLSDLLADQRVDPALNHSFNAAAFAAFGNSHNLVNMLQSSRVECNRAIQAVNAALQSPETAAKDSTLVAAMLLSTFETVVFVHQPDINACIDYFSGCLALLMIRGPKQLDTRFGLKIFLQVYFLVVTACIQKEHALPSPISKLRIYIHPYLDTGDCSWRILDLMARFTDLLAAVKDQNHQLADWPLQLISISTKLDDDFQAITKFLPPNWNCIRLCRIILQKIILDNCHPALDPSSLQYHIISKTITQLSTDICATVPQHAGYLRLLQPQQIGSQSPSNWTFSAQQEADAYTAGIYSRLFPLFVVGKMKLTPIQHKKWFISRLEYLGRISGISQTFAGADPIKSDHALWVSETGGGGEALSKSESI
jgi:hypothetical protein